MDIHAPHVAFVIAAYAVALAALVGVTLHTVQEYRRALKKRPAPRKRDEA